MAFQPGPQLPDISRLLPVLNNSGIQKTNQPLYQVIKSLLDYIQQSNAQFSTGTGGGGGVGPIGPAGANAVSFLYAIDGIDGEDGQPGTTGAQGFPGNQGIQGQPGLFGIDGIDGDEGVMGFPGIQGIQGPPPVFTNITQTLVTGVSGNFQITGLAGLISNKNVLIVETNQPVASKGNATDEFEMDAIVLTGIVLNATTINVSWFVANGAVAVGDYAFAFSVNG